MNERQPRAAPQQAGVIPFRVRDGVVEICLITTVSDRRWSIPKGLIDPGDTPTETAHKEAREEAGLTGEILGPALGRYDYTKWRRKLTVEVYLLRVTGAAPTWLEMKSRERRWVSSDEAVGLLQSHPCRELLTVALDRIGSMLNS